MSQGERERWCAAVEAGVRLGAITEPVARIALAKLEADADGLTTEDRLASVLGLAPAVLADLLVVVSAGGAATPPTQRLTALAEYVLETRLRTCPPTERETPDDLPTMQIRHVGGATQPTVMDPLTDAPGPSLVRSGGEAGATPSPSSGSSWRPNIPRRLGPYELLGELGHGGMGIVFKARHRKLGTLSALKVLIAGEHASPEELERFQLEAAAVARMGKHPHIVAVHDFATQEGLTYYAMEFVDGQSLTRRLRERDLMPQEAAKIMEKVARALHFAHTHKIIHRDLKPENVIVRADGEPQVMDFGLARDVGRTGGRSIQGCAMGTPNYMAPEQARGEHDKCDARTDVYGLGGILYEMLTGFPPHPGQSWPQVAVHILRGDIIPPRSVRPETPRDLETICLKCLEGEKGKRYATAEALAEDLARFQRGEPVHARPVGYAGRFVRRVRRHPLVSALVAGVVSLLLAVCWSSGLLAPCRLRVITSPGRAQVEAIGGTLWGGESDSIVQIDPGHSLRRSYWVWPARSIRLRATAKGFKASSDTVVEARPFSALQLAIILEPDYGPGTLSVDSDPQGAEIMLDGVTTKKVTPQEGLSVTPGPHFIQLSVADHDPYEKAFQVPPEGRIDMGKVILRHERVLLQLTGSPDAMRVTVYREMPLSGSNQEPVRQLVRQLFSPATTDLETGNYWLRAESRGYFPHEQRVVAKGSAETRMRRLLKGWRMPAVGLYGFDGPATGENVEALQQAEYCETIAVKIRLSSLHAGVSRLRLGDARSALEALAEARQLHLRAPDGAVYEWIASRLWKECPVDRRKEADVILLESLGFEPDIVFDTLVECRALLAQTDPAELRAILDRAASKPTYAPECPLLVALRMPDGLRPYAIGLDLADLLGAARRGVLTHIEKGEGSAGRWHGYLALIADALGETDAFAQSYATYLDLPPRPESLDLLLAEAAGMRGAGAQGR